MAVIVELSPDQWERLRAVRIQALEDAPFAYGSTAAEAYARSQADWIDAFSTGRWFVAVDSANDIGLVQLSRQTIGPDCALGIFSMWAADDVRGTGVAGELIDAAVGAAREVHAPKVVLWVKEGNDRALGFYKKMGFVVANPDISLVEDCEVFMERNL